MSRSGEAYKAALQKINVERARVGAIMPAVLVMAFSVLDFFSYPEYAGTFLSLRVVCTALLLLILAVSYTPFGLLHGKALGIIEMSIIGVIINTMIRYAGYETPYYAGLNLVILAIGVLFPWGLRETLLTSGFIYGCYLVPILLFDTLSNRVAFVNNNIFLLATIVIASTASYFSSLLRQREFEAHYHLEEARIEVERQYHELQEMDRLKSRFFSNISHELRTPLTLLMGPTQALLSQQLGALTEKQAAYLRIIRTHSARLFRLINALLDLSKADAKMATLTLERGDFVHFVGQIVDSTRPLAEEKSLTLSFDVDGTIPEFLYDPDKVEEVLLNLLSNALKFTERGGIRVSCAMQWNNVLVKVSDTGIGISKKFLPKLFDRFFQVDTAASRVGAGTGIGLSLAKEWIELHKGRIWVESEEGRGTTFSFTLPMRIEEIVGHRAPEERRPVPSVTSLPMTRDLAGLHPAKTMTTEASLREGAERILLVDDNPDMLRFMADQLKNEYTLLFAADGEEGVRLARSEHPDLVVSDIMMPLKDGYQLCRELKADPQTATIPVIFLTAKGGLSNKIEGLDQGADDYLTKPFDREELLARVRSLIKRTALQKELSLKNRRLEEALAELKRVERDLLQSEKMASLGLLMAGIAHEMRNPINFAKGSLLFVRDCWGKLTPESVARPEAFAAVRGEIEASLQVVESGLTRVEGVIKDLSVFIRGNEGRVSDLDLHASLDLALKFLRYEGLDGVNVHRDYGAIGRIEAFPDQIHQSFLNIFQNALHAMENCENKQLFIGTRSVGNSVVVSVRDTGVGIPESDRTRLFEPFFTTREVGKGMGLGLSLVYKMIVETHRGTIDVKSQVGEGTEFIITLPVKQPVTNPNEERGL